MEKAADREPLGESNGSPEPPEAEERPGKLRGRLRTARELQRELVQRAQESEELARIWRQKATELESRVEILNGQAAIRDDELEAARRRVGHLQWENDVEKERGRGLRADLDQVRNEAAVERERHKRKLKEIDSDLAPLREQLDRVASSRSWRFGHGAMRFLRALTFRRAKGDKDALRTIADRVELVRRKARNPET